MRSINPKLIHLPKHRRDKLVGAVLEDSLRKQYGWKNIRVVRGDSVRVMRGEYKGVEGKVEKVDRKSTRLNSSHANISYAVFCLKKKKPASSGPRLGTRRLDRGGQDADRKAAV